MEERRAQGTGAVQLDRMLDDLPVAVAILDGEGQQVHANRTFWELFAVPVSRRAESGLSELLHPEEELGDDLFGALTAGEAEKVRISREFVRPDGSGFRGQITAVSLEHGADQPWFLCVVDDVSERVSAADELGRLARVVESTSDLVGVLDLSGRVIYLNNAARAFFAITNASTASSTDLYAPESIVKFATEIRPLIEGGRTWAGELAMVRADGVVVPVLQSIAPDDQGHGPLRLSVVGRPVPAPELGAGPRVGGADELVVGLAAQLVPLQQTVVAAASEIEKSLPGTAGAIREAASVLDRMVGDLDELFDGADQSPAPLVAADPVVVARTLIDELSLEGVDLSLEIRPQVPWLLPDSATLHQTIRRALDAVANSSDPAVVRLLPGPGPDSATMGIEVVGPRAADLGDLGLLVLRRFVQRRGGSMWAVTEDGRGTVTIELPVDEAGASPAPSLPTVETPALSTAGRRRQVRPPGSSAPTPIPDPPAPAVESIPMEPAAFVDSEPEVTPAVRSLRVLAVDDNEISQMLVADHLRELGHSPFLTDCGSTVPDLVGNHEPDVILLAVELPDTDGPDLCRYLRATGWNGPILGITAEHSTDCRDRCQAAGMDGLLTKPVEFEILGSLLEQAMDLCAPSGAHFAPAQAGNESPAPSPPPPVPPRAVVEPQPAVPAGEPEPAPRRKPISVVIPPDPSPAVEPVPAPEVPASGGSTVRHVLDTLAVELGGRDRAVSMVESYLADFDGRIGRLLSDNRIDAQSAVDGLLSVSAMLGLHDMVEQCLLVNASLAQGVSHPHADDVRAVATVSKVALETWLAARPLAVT